MTKYARVMWDFQLAMFGFRKRENKLASTPATVPVNRQKTTMKDLDIPLDQFWYDYVQDLNPAESRGFITRPHTGWVNEDWVEGESLPAAESLVMSGNALLVQDVSDGFALIDGFDFERDRPKPAIDNYLSAPWRVHKFTVITHRNFIRNPGAALDVYFPVLRRPGAQLWISTERIEFFPELPMQVTVQLPTIVHVDLQEPSDRLLPAGVTVEIRKYRLSGSSVWAEIQDGWIPLLVNGSLAPTSWKMNTPTAVPSKAELAGGDLREPEGAESPAAPAGDYEVTITAVRVIVRQAPEGNKVGELVQGRRVRVVQQATRGGQSWLRIGDKRWIPQAGTRRVQ